jgi:serine phosphatase RsbU (regulator of sigma subunit)
MNNKKIGRALLIGGLLLVILMFMSGGLGFSSRLIGGKIVYIVSVTLGLVICFTGICILYFRVPSPRQKKVIIRSFIFSVFFFALGVFFKRMYWPGANAMVVIGLLLFCFTFLPLAIKHRYEEHKHIFSRHHSILSLSDFTSLVLIFLSVLFKFLSWPGSEIMLLIGVIGFTITMVMRNRAFSTEVLKRHEAEKRLKSAFGELEEKNKEILDSINYAQRIQHALLASEGMLRKNLPEHFVLFKPKDIVSGDFYWACEAHDKFYFVVADSTGHGVPGAFMSLLNISFLNEAINEKGIKKPNEVLAHVRSRLITSLAIEGSNEGGNDGMDCILMVLDKSKTKLEVSCAHNPLLIIHTNELREIAADKIPVGKSVKNEQAFTTHTIDLKKGDILYAFTDGFADQFGGPNGKKLKYKALCNTLLENKDLPLSSQKENLLKLFSAWKGDLEQVDDVLIAGIRI